MASRRSVLRTLAAALPALRAWPARAQAGARPAIHHGPFQGTRESLAAYRIPDWYRDAKLGIWAHWGPQSAAEAGDWYARHMYMQGSPQYEHHLKHYGHPSKVGFKDVIAGWKAESFDPAHLIRLYKAAGARYFVSMGVHHDNFDLWDSRHTRWNSVKMGPRRDIVGEFRKAARAEGLRFGVSDHLWISYKWFSVSRGSDKEGPHAGVPYDGRDPSHVDLYHDCPRVHDKLEWNEDDLPPAWQARWFARIKDLVDQHQPDLLYGDGHIPFGEWGLSLAAHLYNQDAARHEGAVEAVFTSKRREDAEVGTCVFDVERGVVETIWPRPWQTDTCIGNWHYLREAKYKPPKVVIDMLVDVVSRNGNLMLNFPLPASGALDAREQAILAELTAWMAINGEAIHGTRPWRIFGEGPATSRAAAAGEAKFNEAQRQELTARDVRFTTKGETVYAFCMGWPADGSAVFAPLAPGGAHGVGRIRSVERLGFPGKLEWKQDQGGLRIALGGQPPAAHAVVFRVSGA
jgi:alpha-L-fucosidase